jgi:ubiquinone/menaquinone biosynthesis C-methylase UbiE
LEVTAGVTEPLLLDVATGTGRVPFDLLLSDTFNGRIVGIDASRKMLALAAAKLAAPGERVLLVRHTADPLPFATATFDVVTCLESLEFFPSDEAALQEMKRVLRPGRYLLTTRRRGWEGKSFVGRYRSRDNMRHLLAGLDFYNIGFHPWQVNYDLVTARKPVHL